MYVRERGVTFNSGAGGSYEVGSAFERRQLKCIFQQPRVSYIISVEAMGAEKGRCSITGIDDGHGWLYGRPARVATK